MARAPARCSGGEGYYRKPSAKYLWADQADRIARDVHRRDLTALQRLAYIFGPLGWSHDGGRATTAQLRAHVGLDRHLHRQTWLIAAHRVQWHRRLGVVAAVLAVGIIARGAWLTVAGVVRETHAHVVRQFHRQAPA